MVPTPGVSSAASAACGGIAPLAMTTAAAGTAATASGQLRGHMTARPSTASRAAAETASAAAFRTLSSGSRRAQAVIAELTPWP